jgi:hypothetical protein
MQEMSAQESIYQIPNVICGMRDQADMFYPELAGVGDGFGWAFILDGMWECQSTDILTQCIVQELNAMTSKSFVMQLEIDRPRLTATASRKIVMERRM